MEPDNTIQRMIQALQEVHSENELILIITKSLEFLRGLWLKNRDSFNEEQIILLKRIAETEIIILTFINIKNNIKNIDNIDDFNRAISDLIIIYKKIQQFPIRKSVGKEIRSLRESFNELTESRQKRKIADIKMKIAQMEHKPPFCHNGHKMIIREGESGYFWGCHNFPKCFFTKELSKKERKFLFS